MGLLDELFNQQGVMGASGILGNLPPWMTLQDGNSPVLPPWMTTPLSPQGQSAGFPQMPQDAVSAPPNAQPASLQLSPQQMPQQMQPQGAGMWTPPDSNPDSPPLGSPFGPPMGAPQMPQQQAPSQGMGLNAMAQGMGMNAPAQGMGASMPSQGQPSVPGSGFGSSLMDFGKGLLMGQGAVYRDNAVKALVAQGVNPNQAYLAVNAPAAGVASGVLSGAGKQTQDITEFEYAKKFDGYKGTFEHWMQQKRAPTAPTLTAQIEERKAAAIAQGLDPNDPQNKAYILTGKMPREDQQPLTATDKKAILEADEHVTAAQTAISSLKEAKVLSKKAYEGPLAGKRGYIAGLLGSEDGQATTDFDNLLTTNALTQMKAIFGGNPTEGERQILLEIQGASSQPDAVRQKIIDRAIVMAERRLSFSQKRAEEMRGGTFYKSPNAPQANTAAPAAAAPQRIRIDAEGNIIQ